MVVSPLETLANKYDNVIIYDDRGDVAGVFVKFYKCKSSDLVAGLPNHTHPAFIINGVEQDYILLGKYKASYYTSTDYRGVPLGLPRYASNPAYMFNAIKASSPVVSCMTVADYGFLKLWAQKYGIVLKGNTQYGQDVRDATVWKIGESYSADDERAYEGWLYKALVNHTSAAANKPDIAPMVWKRIKMIGGLMSPSDPYAASSSYDSRTRTRTGSGPLDWFFGSDPGSLADLCTGLAELQAGYRMVNMELQILPNNDAADPAADLSATSEGWKAILPTGSGGGYELVTPGTAGTLHWRRENSVIVLDNRAPDESELTNSTPNRAFKDLTASSTLTDVPSIVKEMGLFPTDSSDKTSGTVLLQMTANERLPIRGSIYSVSSASIVGMGGCRYNVIRGDTAYYHSIRPRALVVSGT